MHRWSAAAVSPWRGWSARPCLRLPAQAGTSGLVVKVTPSQGLKTGQMVTVSGQGLPKSSGGKPQTWFVTECTAAVRGRVDPATDTPHCDITHAQALTGQHQAAHSAPATASRPGSSATATAGRPASHLRHRRGDRPGAGHRRADHVQDGATAACVHLDHDHDHGRLTTTAQASCSHSRWL